MIGSQVPTVCVEPPREGTDGEYAAALMAAYGNALDPWQKTVIDCWLGTVGGAYNVMSAGLTLPRQNGKNVCLEAREFYGLLIGSEKILHTAHQVRTSKKSFRRLAALFTDKRHPEITDCVKNIRYTNGEESIELSNGGLIEFSARSRQAARGFDGISLVVFDEAQELTDDQIEAIMATLSASATGTRQIIYAGTPPYPGCPGTVFRKRREICLGDAGKHDCWHEWGVAGKTIEDIDANNRELWYAANPALGLRLSEDFTAEECRTMSKDGFARERLGWWAPVIEKSLDLALDAEKWAACASDERKPEGKTAYGIKFSYDGAEVVLCGAVCPEDGRARISLIERKSTGLGVGWLAEWLNSRAERASCVVIDGRNGADVLIDKLSGAWRQKGAVVRPRAADIIASVGMLTDAINEGTVSWYRPQEDLNASAINCTRRPLSGGWAFGGADSPPIEAAALALWGCRTTKRDPNKKMRIG